MPGLSVARIEYSDSVTKTAMLRPDAMTPEDEFALHARGWARQTILFTLQYRLTGHETGADGRAEVARASRESAEVLNRLWTAAATQSQPLTHTVQEFVRLVLEWSSENLPQTSARRCARN
jgi:hypothetical protein